MNARWARGTAALAAVLALSVVLAACGGGSKKSSSTSGAAGGTTSSGSTATSGTVAAASLRLGYVVPPAHPYGIAVNHFIANVKTLSGDKIKIAPVPNYTGGDIPLLNDVKGGTIDMASVSSAVWGTQGVHSFDALQMPFLINRYDLEAKVISGSIGEQMLKGTDKLGLVGLAIHEGGLRKPLGTKKALVTPADFRGLKIRSVQSPVLISGLRALGAQPTPIAVGDVFNALRDGTVNAMEANLGLIQVNKYYEVAKFVTRNVNLWPFPTVLVMNKAKFDSLSAAQQQIIKKAAADVPGFSISFFLNPANDPTGKLCSEGIKFASASPATLTQLQKEEQGVYTRFSKDAETGRYIRQIQALKAGLPAPKAPAALPSGCAAT